MTEFLNLSSIALTAQTHMVTLNSLLSWKVQTIISSYNTLKKLMGLSLKFVTHFWWYL
jgi:hypothetical protein